MMKKGAAVWSVLFVVVVLAAAVHEAAAACDTLTLLPCLSAISGGGAPSATCCANLKAQQPCFCEYIANPNYKPYIDSPNARKVAAACGVAIPTC